MTAVLEIDLRDKRNPPPDDPVKAPHGWMWDRNHPPASWRPRKRPARGGWLGKVLGDEPRPAPAPEDMEPFEEQFDYTDPDPGGEQRRLGSVPREGGRGGAMPEKGGHVSSIVDSSRGVMT